MQLFWATETTTENPRVIKMIKLKHLSDYSTWEHRASTKYCQIFHLPPRFQQLLNKLTSPTTLLRILSRDSREALSLKVDPWKFSVKGFCEEFQMLSKYRRAFWIRVFQFVLAPTSFAIVVATDSAFGLVWDGRFI